jgi:hypothetical protein
MFLNVPVKAHEQMIRTNVLGYLYGAHAIPERNCKDHPLDEGARGRSVPRREC